MKIPYTWLSEFIDISDISPEDIARELTLRSVETSLQKFERGIDGVVFGKVVDVKPHPTKQNLVLCQVNVGSSYYPKLITADKSVKVGDGVIVALPNAKVGNMCISKKNFDGVVSEGMLLSAQELELEAHSEEVLKIQEDFPPGTSAYDLLGFGEYILEIEITPNRGDMLSVRGVARELCAIFSKDLKEEKVVSFEDFGDIDIQILDSDCKRYRGALLESVVVKPSPLWLRKRLWQCGLRTVSNIVDITNYIMLRDGQPLHAFDADIIKGGIRVRKAKQGERVLTFTGTEKELTEENLVIADEDKAIAVAGVIGFENTGVSNRTKRILLESAYFEPYRIRRSSKLLGIHTDSSYRFERGIDIEGVKRYQDNAIELILDIAGGELVALRDVYPMPYKPKSVFLSVEKYRRYTGEHMDRKEVSDILNRLSIPNKPIRCGIEVNVPSHRSFDIHTDVDIIEEVLRIKGYDSLDAQVIRLPSVPFEKDDPFDKVRCLLKSRGFFEIISFSFEDLGLYELLGIEKPSVEISNPLIKSQTYMRTSLIPSLIRACLYNQRQHNYHMALFELGRVYFPNREEDRLGILLTGAQRLYPQENYTPYHALGTFLDLGRLLGMRFESGPSSYSFLHPKLQVELLHRGEKFGFLGQLNPRVAEILGIRGDVFVGELKMALSKESRKSYKPFSKFPPVIRDLSLVVDKDTPVDKLIFHMKDMLKERLEEVKVFSIYTGSDVGEGKKSVSFRLVFRNLEGTMSDEEANSAVRALVSSLEESFGAKLR